MVAASPSQPRSWCSSPARRRLPVRMRCWSARARPMRASLAGAPGQVSLRFSEDISARFRLVSLLDGRGRVVAGTRVRSGADARTLLLDVPRLPRGTYEVT